MNDNKAIEFANTKNSILLKYFQWYYESGNYKHYNVKTRFNFKTRIEFTKIIRENAEMNITKILRETPL